MAVKFTEAWGGYYPGEVATPSGPHTPSERELVEEMGVADYYTTEADTTTQTDAAGPTPKSEHPSREDTSTPDYYGLREKVQALGWGDLQSLAKDVREKVGEKWDDWSSDGLIAFVLDHPEACEEALR